VLTTADWAAMIDWDKVHAAVSDLDPVQPHNAAFLADDAHNAALQAFAA